MSNLYNLVESLNSFLEIFENIQINKKFVSFSNESLDKYLRLISVLSAINPDEPEVDNDFIENLKSYEEIIKFFNGFSNDEVFYNKDNVVFSIGFEKKHADKIMELYNNFLETKNGEFGIELKKFLQEEVRPTLFNASVEFIKNVENVAIYSIGFFNYESGHASTNNEQESLISKAFNDIFGVILEYAKKLNINFDKSIFYFSGTTEGEKDKNKNRRLTAYHLAHINLLEKQYDNIDRKELSKFFRSGKIHPFLYRPNKDHMYISVSDKVDLTEFKNLVNNNDNGDDPLQDTREELWEDFLQDMLNNPGSIDRIVEFAYNQVEMDFNIDVGELDSIFTVIFDDVFALEKYFKSNKDDEVLEEIEFYDKIYEKIEKLVGKEFEKEFTDDQLIEELKKHEDNNLSGLELVDFVSEREGRLTETFSSIKDIETAIQKDFHVFVKKDLTGVYDRALERYVSTLEEDFLNGEYDDWIREIAGVEDE